MCDRGRLYPSLGEKYHLVMEGGAMDIQNINTPLSNVKGSNSRTQEHVSALNENLSKPMDSAYPNGPIGSERVSLEHTVNKSKEGQEALNNRNLEKAAQKRIDDRKEREEANTASLKKAKELIDKLSLKELGLSFSIDKDFNNRTLISVTDKNTEDVVRQIPSEEFVRMAKAMNELQESFAPKNEKEKEAMIKGLLVDNLV